MQRLFHVEHSSASKTGKQARLAAAQSLCSWRRPTGRAVYFSGHDQRLIKMTAWTCSTWNEYSSLPHVVPLRLFRGTMARPRHNGMFHVEHCPATIDHGILTPWN